MRCSFQTRAGSYAWALLIFIVTTGPVNGAIRTPPKAGARGQPPPTHALELIDLFHVSNSDGFTPKFKDPPLPLDDAFDLSQITRRIGPQDFFEEMSPLHREAVQELEKLLKGFHLRTDFAQIALALRDHSDLNPTVWARAVLTTILRRPDRAHFRIPALVEVEPDFALPAPTIRELLTRAEADAETGTGTGAQPACVVVDDRTGSDNGEENQLWYFREDPMVNSHHWFWHLTHPWDTLLSADRHGELFYATHHSMSARYHAERLSNDLSPITPFVLDEETLIPTGYNPHLTDLNSQQEWVPRPHKQPIPPWAIARGINVTMGNMKAWHAAIVGAIKNGCLQRTNGSRVHIRTARGIDELALALEATMNTVNPELYGWIGYHNSGHSFIGNSVVRPGESTPTSPRGVMAGTVGSMRDPIFYRWHEHMNRIYDLHKATLEPYQRDEGEFALNWPGVNVERVEVQLLSGRRQPAAAAAANKLTTYFTYTSYDLTNGLDFKRNISEGQGKVEVCVKHLAHEEFEYKIQINNSNPPSTAAVRIYLAPRFGPGPGSELDPSELRHYPIEEQHKLFFPMDTFTVDLVTGHNSISRPSTASTTTISLRQGLTELNQDQIRGQVYCGCGWPGYMLLPKGKPGPAGMVFDLFVMVTREDPETRIPKHTPLSRETRSGRHRVRAECQEAYLMCGRYNALFPDPKPMLYPFDRPPDIATATAEGNKYLEDFMSGMGNMAATQITITHLGETDIDDVVLAAVFNESKYVHGNEYFMTM